MPRTHRRVPGRFGIQSDSSPRRSGRESIQGTRLLASHFGSPEGARCGSPGRSPGAEAPHDREAPKGRAGCTTRRSAPLRGYGGMRLVAFPGLRPWAAIARPCGAGVAPGPNFPGTVWENGHLLPLCTPSRTPCRAKSPSGCQQRRGARTGPAPQAGRSVSSASFAEASDGRAGSSKLCLPRMG